MRTHVALTSLLLLAVGIFHALRAYKGWDLALNSYIIPLSLSWTLGILAIILALLGVLKLKK